MPNERAQPSRRNSYSYPFIVAWSQMMGSQDWYIRDQVELAQEEGAPQRAISKQYPVGESKRGTGPGYGWHTVDDVRDADKRAQLERAVAEAQAARRDARAAGR